MVDFHRAVRALYSNVTVVNGDIAYDKDGNEVEVDQALIDSWVDPDEHKYQRMSEYPSIGDQLDALYHAGVFPEDMANKIKAVKDKYPKNSED
mgnify:FL=1|tara:strand:+ start:1420 stop:1698 length:279 start_codon:yes stop_codon:yes gene_type:complete